MDNKHDGWVAEFVYNMKGELESILKFIRIRNFYSCLVKPRV